MNYKAVILRSFGLFLFSVCVSFVRAQDTLQLTVPKAEALFLQNNLSLIAAQYNINASEALVQQAKAWDNPVLNTDQNIYDGKSFFAHGKTDASDPASGGQIFIQLQQLIRTAGKRGLQIKMAQDNTKGAVAQFNNLMRHLRYVLITDLNNLAQLQKLSSLYQVEIINVQTLVKGMDEMLKVGDVSLKDNVRIKALLFSLQSDYADNVRQQQDIQSELKTLLRLDNNPAITVQMSAPDLQQLQALHLSTLLDSIKVRPDVVTANSQLALQQHNLQYQKALVAPDLTVGVEYDKASSYIPNYWGLAISLPLPILNRNRGNIVASQWNIKQAQAMLQQTQSQAQNEVVASYNKLMTLLNVQKSASGPWQDNYETILRNMMESYRQRRVSLIDFVDFFDSYKEAKTKQLQQQTNLLNAAAELNFVSNQNLIPLK
jgi:cobalt-zinc-cadmium efflux system outer membrane protein